MSNIKAFLKRESGASAAEYALILAVVAVGLAIAAGLLGTNISSVINAVAGSITT
jgi:pilus assembly protein Flp/PilA